MELIQYCQNLDDQLGQMCEFGDRGERVFHALVDPTSKRVLVYVNQYDEDGNVVGEYDHYRYLGECYPDGEGEKEIKERIAEEYVRLKALWAKQDAKSALSD